MWRINFLEDFLIEIYFNRIFHAMPIWLVLEVNIIYLLHEQPGVKNATSGQDYLHYPTTVLKEFLSCLLFSLVHRKENNPRIQQPCCESPIAVDTEQAWKKFLSALTKANWITMMSSFAVHQNPSGFGSEAVRIHLDYISPFLTDLLKICPKIDTTHLSRLR